MYLHCFYIQIVIIILIFNWQSQIVRPVLGASDNNHGESSISQVQYLNNDYSDSPSKIVSHETPQSSGYVPSNSLMQTLIDGLTGNVI